MFGEVSSPQYPQPYPANLLEQWDLEVPEGYQIQLTFNHLDIEPSPNCCRDSLFVSVSSLQNNVKSNQNKHFYIIIIILLAHLSCPIMRNHVISFCFAFSLCLIRRFWRGFVARIPQTGFTQETSPLWCLVTVSSSFF